MDLIKAEIERKRKAQAELAGGAAAGGKKKWVKKGDLEKARVAQYLDEKAQAEQERKAKQAAQPGSDAGPLASALQGGGDAVVSQAADHAAGSSTEDLRPNDVKRRLRDLKQPIMLFGEGDEERLERYRAVSSALPTEQEVDKSMGTFDEQREFLDLKGTGGAGKDGSGELEQGGGAEPESFKDDEELTATFVPTTPEQIVSRHFKELMRMWEQELGEREPAAAGSAEGKREMGAYLQARRHLRPFFKQLKTRSMPLDVLNTMVEITRHMQQRE